MNPDFAVDVAVACAPAPVSKGASLPAAKAAFGKLLMAAGLLLLWGCTTPLPTELRGPLHHSNAEAVRRQADFAVTLVPAVNGCVCLRFNRIEITTSKETLFYEKYLEYKVPGESDISKIRKDLVPGEYITVAGEVKTEPRTVGPLAGETVQIAGVSGRTDADGILRDTGETILGLFDRQKLADNAEVTLLVRHATLGEKTLNITRRKLFDALGVPQEEPRLASDEGLLAQVALDPATPRPGDFVRITLSVENKGSSPVAKVIGRTFSRQPWVNGRNFYIGTLPPQGKRVFVRTVQVPATLRPADTTVFATVGIWNPSAGSQLSPEKAVPIPFTLTVGRAAPAQP